MSPQKTKALLRITLMIVSTFAYGALHKAGKRIDEKIDERYPDPKPEPKTDQQNQPA